VHSQEILLLNACYNQLTLLMMNSSDMKPSLWLWLSLSCCCFLFRTTSSCKVHSAKGLLCRI